jgi:hypothetical protein
VALAPIPSPEEIVRLYKAGELAAELARFHERPDGEDDPFLKRCVALHNDGHIDLVVIPGQSGFVSVTGHDFFTAQHFYCEAIPDLRANVTTLMECCHILIEKAGNDGAASQPNGAFRKWCQNNAADGAVVIREARSGDQLARKFVTFALQASENVQEAVDFVRSFDDDRRLSAMAALAGMTFTDPATAHKAIQALEPFVTCIEDDTVRANGLLAVFDVLKKQNDEETASRLAMAAAKDPGPSTLHSLAHVVWLHHKLLSTEALRTALVALENVRSEHLATVRILDMALRHLLATADEPLALNFLTVKLRDGKLTLENFQTTAGELKRNNPQRLYELIVRWLLSSSIALCDNVGDLVGIEEKRPFDTSIQPFGLTALQQIFLCRKAIGFLFLRPVVCCSIIVSVLRGVEREAEEPVTALLFDPLLLSYSGGAIDYLKGISAGDPAHAAIQIALSKHDAYFAGLERTGLVKELHPSDYKRDVVRQRTHDEMRGAQKAAERQSVLFGLVHRSTLLYGKRSLTYIEEDDGSRRAVSLDLHSVGMSVEWPRRDILDPVGLDYMIRVYRVEKLQ